MKQTFKRFISFLLALTMVVTILPVSVFAKSGDSVEPIEGKVLVTVTGSNSKPTVSLVGEEVTATSTPSNNSCTGAYTGQTTTVTITNKTSNKATISFNCAKNDKVKDDVTVTGASMDSAGNVTAALDGNGSFTLTFSSKDEEGNAVLTLTNFNIVEEKSVNVTAKAVAAEFGSYTVNGEAVTADKTITTTSATGVSLVASPAEGYSFAGWYNETTEHYVSFKASISLLFEDDVVILPKFTPKAEAAFGIQDAVYASLDEALAAAGMGSVIRPLKDVTLTKNYTIPYGVTLLVPFDDAGTCLDETTVNYVANTSKNITRSVYRTLTLAEGVTLNVQGALSVSAKHRPGNGSQNWGGTVDGGYGVIQLNGNSKVNVESGAKLYAFGFILGSGSVEAKPNATVYEIMQVTEFIGGNNLLSHMSKHQENRFFIFTQYYVQNIETALKINSGANLNVFCSMTVSNETFSMPMTFIGNGGMFTLNSGSYVVKDYDPSADRLNIDAYGDVSLSGISMTMKGLPIIGSVAINSKDFYLPVNSSITVNVNSGTATINQDLTMLPDSRINVASGAQLYIPSGTRVNLYDKEDWGPYVFSNKTSQAVSYIGSTKAASGRTLQGDAVMDINGVVINAGEIYTTEGGAQIISSQGNGVYYQRAAAPAKASSIGARNCASGIAWESDPANPAWLLNADGTYVETIGSAAETVYIFSNTTGKWEVLPDAVVTIDPNGGQGNAITHTVPASVIIQGTQNKFQLPDASEVGFAAPEHYTFAGWNTAADGTGDAYKVGDILTITETITLYAIWQGNPYNLYEDGTLVGEIRTGTDLKGVLGEDKVYKFYSDAECTTEVTLIDNKMPGHELYAKTAYTLKFLDENGNVLKDAEGKELVYLYTADETVTATYPEYTKDGYTITWNKEIPKKLTENLEITAEATAASYTVSFYDGDADAGEVTTDENGNVTIISLQGDGKHKVFKGWATTKNAAAADDNYKPETQVKLTGNLDLYAVWETTKCTDGEDADHVCDICQGEVEGETCVDADKNHYCDECGEKTSKCEDTDKDHVCDNGCDVFHGTHADGTDKDHLCDYGCGEIADDGCHGGTATCNAKAVCEECGEPYGELDANNHAGELKYTNNGDGTHSSAYECCQAAGVTNEKHIYNAEHVCVCDDVKSFTITFANTGDTSMNPITMNYGERISYVSNPEKAGYKFVGWTDENGDTVTIPVTMPGKNMILTAQWECLHAETKAEYENNSLHAIVCSCGTEIRTEAHSANEDGYCACGAWAYVEDFNGGKNIDHASADHLQHFFDDKFEMSWNQDIMETIMVREGYVFAGYAYDAEGTVPVKNGAVFNEPTTVYVMWEPVLYTLTIKTNNDEIAGDSISMSVEKCYESADEMFEALNRKTITGYRFNGYTYEDGTKVKFPFRYPATDLTLIEQYVANEYTLIIDLGEHGKFANDKTTAQVKAAYKEIPEYPAYTVNDGYKLTGWNVQIGENITTATNLPTEMLAHDATYTAVYKLLDVTVNFNEGKTSELTGKYFGKVTAPALNMEGHTFLGWAETAAEDAEIVYAPGAEITLNKDVDGKTFCAKWQIKTFDVTYVNGETSETVTVDWNSEITVKPLNDTASHTFNGWLGSDSKTYVAGDKITIKADLTLTAQWKINEYTITWIVEGAKTTTTVEHGKTPVFTGTPTKTEDDQYTYTFAGWTPAIVEATGPATYTATFTPVLRSYDITFVVDGVETKVSTKYGETPAYNAEGKDPEKATDAYYSYEFKGWATTEGGEVTGLEQVSGVATYYAVFGKTPVEHTITFVITGEEGVFHQVKGGYGTAVDYSGMPSTEKPGYSLAWDKAETEWPKIIPEEDITITGTYTINQYTITFMDGETKIGEVTDDYGAAITAPAVSKEGHKLTGWKDADGNIFSMTIPADNKTVYAQWEAESYDVTWKINGETYTTTSVVYGTAITAPNPAKDGYTFSGWSAFPEKMPAEPLTISGSWTPINYTITFMNGDVEYAEITAAYESEITMPEEPIKEGCTFAGWVDEDGNSVNLTTMPLNGMTVYADFTIDTFKVNFYASEDDTQAFASFDVVYGTKLTATYDDPATEEIETDAGKLAELLAQMTEPDKEGHTWKEWDLEVEIPETMPAKTLNFYGKWDVNSYTVTAEGQTYTFQYGKAVTIPEPTKAGYTFIEWNETVPTTMPAQNVVLTAKWNPNTYTITFVGADVENITATYGTAITKPADPTMVGYTFQGWSVNGKTVIEFPATMPVDGLNLKAVWAPDTIYITWIIDGVETVLSYDFGTAITAPEATKATDAKWSYKHTGWDKNVPATALVNDTFTALFEEDEAVKYTVKFLDGETVVYETKIAWDGEVSLDGFTAPVKEHNTLAWTLDGEKVTFPYEMTTKQVTFLAQWTPVMYTVTIDGGKPVSYPYGAELHIDDPAPKEGHTFAGWLKNGTAYQIPDTMPGENLKLTSSWTVNTYTLTVSSNDAEGNYVEKILTVPYGAKLSQYYLETPSYIYEGKLYEFDRWAVWTWETGKDETMVPYEGSTMPASDVTMYTTSTVTGWETDEDGNTTYYVKSEMVYFDDMVTIDGAEYWFNADGYIVKDITLTDDGYCAFDHESGKFLSDYTGIYEALNGDLYYVVDGMAVQNKGLVKDQFVNEQGKIHTHYYYFGCDAVGCTAEACMGAGQFKAQRNVYHWVENDNGMLMKGGYTFGDDGVIEHTEDTNRHGIQVVDGVKYYLMDGVKVHKGLFIDHGYYYYARTSGALVVNENYWVGSSKLNNLDLKAGTYTFDEEGRIVFGGGKTGIYAENNTLYYYVDGVKTYAGLIQYTGDLNNADGSVTNDVYNNSWIYVNTQGEVKNGCDYWISKTNDHMIAKSYTFDVNGIMQNPQVSDSAEIKNGVYAEDGSLYFYVNNKRSYDGLIIYSGDLHKADGTVVEGVYDNDFIYVNTQGEVKNGCNYWISKNNGYMKNKSYNFDENGIMTNPQPIA